VSAAQSRLELRGRIELDDFPVDAAWSPDAGTLAVAGGEGAIVLLDCKSLAGIGASGSQSAPIDAIAQVVGHHAGGALAVTWQQAGVLFATSGQDGVVRLWDARSRTARSLYEFSAWVERLAFAPQGRLLGAAAGKKLAVFDTRGEWQQLFDAHPGVISAIAWRPRANEIAAVGNGGACIHRLEPHVQSREYPWPGAALSASWSPDGRLLAAGLQDGSVHLWYVANATQSEMKGYGVKVALTGWSANGRYLATSAGAALIVWEFGSKGPQGSQALELRGHSERIVALAFRPAGSWLASAAHDRRLLLWRVGQSEQAVDAHLLPADCSLLRWSHDGHWLCAGDQRGGISLFEFQL